MSYEEREWREMERYFRYKREGMKDMDEMYYGYDDDKRHDRDKDCDCWKKDEHKHDDDDHFVCICKRKKKKKEEKKDDHKHHKHKHFHEHKHFHCEKDDHKKKDDKKKHDDHDDKHDMKKKKDRAELVDVACDTPITKTRRNQEGSDFINNTPRAVANVKLERVRNGDTVLLNGVVGLRGVPNAPGLRDIEVRLRIFRGTPPTITAGNEIYMATITVEEGDFVQFPFTFCDKIHENDKDVMYTVTVERFDADNTGPDARARVVGPVTLTALQIHKKKKDC